jgi:hypothetical protein
MKALALIVLATIALIVAPLLWHAPRCTGPTPADRCPLAGTSNTSLSNNGSRR